MGLMIVGRGPAPPRPAARAPSGAGRGSVIQRQAGILTLTNPLDENDLDAITEEQIDADMVVYANVSRLKKLHPSAVAIDADLGTSAPIPAAQLAGLTRLFIVAHGRPGSVADLTPVGMVMKLLKDVAAQGSGIQDKEEKRQRLRQFWQIEEIVLVACSSDVSEGQAQSFAKQMHASIIRMVNHLLPKPIRVVGLKGIGIVDHQGQIRVIPPEKKGEYRAAKAKLPPGGAERRQAHGQLLDAFAYPNGKGTMTYTSDPTTLNF
ncbi:hypothetical protein [Arenibaculum sp.]|uniref:hypothetical protein n=1 Tax=Arenibaculum sp. TaxID=2865862 RepID=UPI002E0E72C2|nr:hypothetical protein [Arenibaculum sp.]